MSTGKRLAKRSILGTRVACWLEDGKYYPGMICDVKNQEEKGPTIYTVRVEGERRTRELREGDLVGSGFTPVNSVKLRAEQKGFITYNGREIQGVVQYHRPNIDEVLMTIINPETGVRQDIKKKLEEVRLLESRKSPRLADTDTDFAKLADCATERNNRKSSSTIDVPTCIGSGSRKRRSSRPEDDLTDECAAALVLMKLSCSPRSPISHDGILSGDFSGASSVSSGVWSLSGGVPSSRLSPGARSAATPSPPLSESSPPPPPTPLDDGIDLDDIFGDDLPRKRRSSTRIMFKCTWSECDSIAPSCQEIEKHVRLKHLGRRAMNSDSESDSEDDHEEEFYWTEVEVNVATWVDHMEPLTATAMPTPVTNSVPTTVAAPSMTVTLSPLPTPNAVPILPAAPTPPSASLVAPLTCVGAFAPSPLQRNPIQQQSFALLSSPPTLSHMDMARPPHEDPTYRQKIGNTLCMLSSSWPKSSLYNSAGKLKSRANSSPKTTTGRGKRSGESRKCRKVYGMDQRDQWCTQCKWKKACSRFSE